MDKDLIQLMTPVPMTDEETEFRAWLKSNKAVLEKHGGPDEIASLAIYCGFDAGIVCQVLSTFRDAIGGTQVEKRAELHVWHFQEAMAEVQRMKSVKELDLAPLWENVHQYQTGGAE